ncbi:RidA family protein [Cupriavidus numazuensis]|uniref:RutC family protein YjgH n=1 Tax=Cupriavidus numazuensis TaxID=221992 RepID=A0ABM8TE27_9BURK|nr:RidA family protein [Cupriavidus numazuensis]CAG2139612.1 RutC family protein YjgH [Cupriavidus numazuensis]
MKRQMINPGLTQARHYDQLHFSSATRVGDMIWVSGQVGFDLATGTVGQGMEAQARQAFENLKTVLEAAGAGMADIVEIMTFHTDMRSDIEAFVKVKDEYLPERYPSWTGVGVSQLARPEFLVEIRAIAVAGCGAG